MLGGVASPRHDVSETVDLVVAGSGAGGLSAAVTAAVLGLSVVVLEKEPVYGGTTAWSGGWLWVPRNGFALAAGIREDLHEPRRYLEHEVGATFDAQRIDAYLAHAPRMVDFFQAHTSVAFIEGNGIPDFHTASPGAAQGGRSVGSAPFDARALGPHVKQLRPPLDLMAIKGMGIASGVELRHYFDALHRWSSFRYVGRRLTELARDLAIHGRSMRLVNGNALAARLAKSAFDRGVALRVDSPVVRLLLEEGRVVGAVYRQGGTEHEVRARRGVVLACGGFPHDPERIRRLFPHAPSGREHHSAAPLGNTGDGLRLGESAGGVVEDRLPASGAWAPVSRVPRADGRTTNYPHLIERAKPGIIAVTRAGRRFVNEAGSYYDFVAALIAATPAGQPVEGWLICDHRFIRRYGLGAARPAPFRLSRWLKSGYLICAHDIAALARACGIDAGELERTLDRYNVDARQGRDTAFGRGDTPFNRLHGDPHWTPNPCVAPIERPPYYAVKVVPGSLGTFAGLRTDATACVVDRTGAPIAGLYACGNDMCSIMGGRYPSGGITLGPAMTFGYLAAHHAAGCICDAGAQRCD